MGAVTIANKKPGVTDRYKVVEADVTFSASYATGGDTLALGLLGLRGLKEILIPSHEIQSRKAVSTASSRAGKTVELAGTETVPLLKVFDTANTEVAAATNLSTVTRRIRFLGY